MSALIDKVEIVKNQISPRAHLAAGGDLPLPSINKMTKQELMEMALYIRANKIANRGRKEEHHYTISG